MAKKEYQSPKMKVNDLHQEDVLTAFSGATTVGTNLYSVGAFDNSWIKSGE